MRHVMLLMVTAVVVGLLIASPVSAAQAKWVRGPVTAMTGDTLTVTVKGAEAAFKIEPATQLIARGAGTAAREAAAAGKPGPRIGDFVKVGDFVEVHYKEAAGVKIATQVRPVVATEEAASGEPSGGTSAAGSVVSVSPSELVIKADGQDRKFVVTPKTHVTGTGVGTKARELASAGKKSPITEFVRPNDRVMVYFDAEGAAPQATGVRILQRMP